MAKVRLISLNGNGGPLVAVLSTQAAARVTGREDESVVSQGLQYKRGDDTTSTLITVGPVSAPGAMDAPQIDLWDQRPFGVRGGKLQGLPQQATTGLPSFQAATTYFSAQSKTAQATTLRVMEYD